VFVLPLLIDYPKDDPASLSGNLEAEENKNQRQLWGLIAFAMCAVSASEYWGFEGINVDERYAQWSVGVLIGYLVILVALAKDAARPFAEPVTVLVADPSPPIEPAPL
jgi:hypothetical protein